MDLPREKLCPSCDPPVPKPLSEFTPDKRKPDGHTTVCRSCLAKRRRDKRKARRDAGEPPPLGKKARARKQVVIQLDERRSGGKGTAKGGGRDAQPATSSGWIPEPPGPAPDTTWYEPFLERLATHRTVTDAARHVGVHPVTVWRALKRDPLLAEAYEYALRSAADRAVNVSWHLGVEGWQEPMVDREGSVVTDTEGNILTRHVYDAAMLRLILQGVAPEYRRGPSVAVQVNTEIHGSEVREKLATIIDGYAAQEQ